MHKLSAQGLTFATSRADDSIVARVALEVHYGISSAWPESFQRAAVEACNESGAVAWAGALVTDLGHCSQ